MPEKFRCTLQRKPGAMRLFLTFRIIGLLAIILLLGCSKQNQQCMVYVGTYTGQGSEGIYGYRFDAASGDISPVGLAGKADNPSFIAIEPDGRYMYAVNEVGSFQNEPSGAVSVFTINSESGKLDLLQQISSLGAGPAHLSLDKSARYLLVANYGGGNVTVFPRGGDGRLGQHTAFEQNAGSGPNPDRQTRPHAHYIGVTNNNRFVMVADLGIDKILTYRFEANAGSLTPLDSGFIRLNPGDGPRHIAFAPSGKFFYVANELTSTIAVFSMEDETGKTRFVQHLSTLPEGFSGSNTVAEIMTDAKGQYLYVSNRGDDSIGVFAIDTGGKLNPVEWISTGGKTPRHFEIDPTGQWLFVANQNSNSINLFKVDKTSGRLKKTDLKIDVVSPVCIRFISRQNSK